MLSQDSWLSGSMATISEVLAELQLLIMEHESSGVIGSSPGVSVVRSVLPKLESVMVVLHDYQKDLPTRVYTDEENAKASRAVDHSHP